MKILTILSVLLLNSGCGNAQCPSIAASFIGGWKPVASAPRDGTTVEMLQTYGVAPWYGIFKWGKFTHTINTGYGVLSFTDKEPSWQSPESVGDGVIESQCLFWRPYKATGKYVDPTGGAQRTVAYWCAAMHLPYDAEADRCK